MRSFVCENWRHTYVYDDNHRFELQFEQNPLDLTRKARVFSTIVAGIFLPRYSPVPQKNLILDTKEDTSLTIEDGVGVGVVDDSDSDLTKGVIAVIKAATPPNTPATPPSKPANLVQDFF